MSKLFDDASLAMIPSAYKDGKLYSIRPTDGSGDFTFSRGSNLAATRVDVNGLIEKGRENLVRYSNDFTNAAWIKFYTGVTDGQEDPFGGTNGTRLVSTGIGGYIYQNGVCIANTRMTASFWVKSNTGVNQDFVFTANGGNQSSSSITTTTSWQRVSFTFSSSSSGDILFGYQTTQLVDLLIYGFQLEQGLVATDYIETGASTAQAGILEDMPRLDYSGGASCPSLLLEPQRSNLFIQSEHLKAWTDNNIIRTANNSISPEGVQNATLISGDGTLGVHRFYQTPAYISGTSYTISIFAKAGTNDFFQIYLGNAFDNSAGQVYANFDLSDGSKGTAGSNVDDYDIEDYGNGWYRCYLTAESQLSGTTGTFYNLTTSDSVGRAASSALTTNVEFYGAQCEAGSYPTSYIPTYGTSQTRSADYMQVIPTDLLGSDSGTWFMELDDMTFNIAGTQVPTIYLGDSTTNCLAIEPKSAANNKGVFLVKEESNVSTTLDDFTISGKTKFCFVWSGTTLKVFRDGVQRYSATNFTQPANWDSFVFNHGTREAFSEIPSILLFPTALTDSECIALTSL